MKQFRSSMAKIMTGVVAVLLVGVSMCYATTTTTLIPGIGILFKTNTGKVVAGTTTTNDKGKTTSGKLAKGTYQLDFSKSQSSGSTPLYPFMLKLDGTAQVTVNGTVWDSTKAIKVEKGTIIQIIVKITDTSISATVSSCTIEQSSVK